MSDFYGPEAYDRHDQDAEGKTVLFDELWADTPHAGRCVVCLSPTTTYPNVCGTCIRLNDDTFSLTLALVAGPYRGTEITEDLKQQRKAALSARNDYVLQRH
ncbi:hypothetical protein [Dietzia sp. MNB45]|uniref:hypothetical protein n=1 Tax=Dietzia sp. MNB45 TaxID=3238800 RepID=UPI003F7E3470